MMVQGLSTDGDEPQGGTAPSQQQWVRALTCCEGWAQGCGSTPGSDGSQLDLERGARQHNLRLAAKSCLGALARGSRGHPRKGGAKLQPRARRGKEQWQLQPYT